MKNKIAVLKNGNHYSIRGLPPRVSSDIDSFLNLCSARGFSERTSRAYIFDLLSFFRWLQPKKISFKKFTFKNKVEFISDQKKLQMAAQSINRRLNTIDQFYRFCFGKNIQGNTDIAYSGKRYDTFLTYDSSIGIHPIKRKSYKTLKVKETQKLIIPIESKDAAKFFKSLITKRDIAIFNIMLFCGLRSCEVISLKIENINWLNSTILVMGKGGRERHIPISAEVEKSLKIYIDTERPALSKSNHVFLVLKGKNRGMPLTAEGFRAIFRYKRATSGVKNANPHRFRHTFARNMAACGMSLPVLQKITGHHDFRTLLKYINLAQIDVKKDFTKCMKEIEKSYGKSIF